MTAELERHRKVCILLVMAIFLNNYYLLQFKLGLHSFTVGYVSLPQTARKIENTKKIKIPNGRERYHSIPNTCMPGIRPTLTFIIITFTVHRNQTISSRREMF